MGVEYVRNKEQTVRQGLGYLLNNYGANRSKRTAAFQKQGAKRSKGTNCLRTSEQTARKGLEYLRKNGANCWKRTRMFETLGAHRPKGATVFEK